jgi:hypothetical protein
MLTIGIYDNVDYLTKLLNVDKWEFEEGKLVEKNKDGEESGVKAAKFFKVLKIWLE